MKKVITGEGVETGVEAEKSRGAEGEGDGDGESDTVEPQGNSQLRPRSHWKKQLTSLATCLGRRATRPMPEMRTVCRNREACSPGLHTRRRYRTEVGDVGGYG